MSRINYVTLDSYQALSALPRLPVDCLDRNNALYDNSLFTEIYHFIPFICRK